MKMAAIPTVPAGGNHTAAFTEAAGTDKSHEVCLNVSKALAAVGMRVLTDEAFLTKVRLVRLVVPIIAHAICIGQSCIRGGKKGER